MNTAEHKLVMRRRLAVALLVVMALVAVAPLSDVVAGGTHVADAAPRSTGFQAQDLAKAGSIDDVARQLEDMTRAEGASAVPPWFQREIGMLPQARDVRTDGISVVGFVVDSACDEALAALTAHMEERGWTAVPLGEAEGATFVKKSGVCTWALATCMQTGASTSIVFRCDAE